jgi:glycosyltransferase involved in cell wall biosynthesis
VRVVVHDYFGHAFPAQLARELAGRGHHVCVFAPAYREADYRRLGLPLSEVDLGASVEVVRLAALPYPTGTSQGRVVLPTGTRWRRVRDLRPDVIHVHLPFSVGLEGLRTARKLDTPLVGTNHTPVTEFLRYSPVRGAWVARLAARYTAWYYAHCDFVSSPARGILEDMRRGGFRARHRVISNPIRLDAFRPLPDRQGLKEKFALSPLTILYAGRLAAEKRVDLVIRAVASLAAEAPRVGLALLGRGAAEAGLRSLCRSLGLDGRVRFLG